MHLQKEHKKKKNLLPLLLIVLAAALAAGCAMLWHERTQLQNELASQRQQLLEARLETEQQSQKLARLQEDYDALLKQEQQSPLQPNGDIPYQSMFPELMLEPLKGYTQEDKVYLTFDDGPSERTAEILDFLAKKEIKATFFVVGSNLKTERGKEILRRIADEGHTIGIHTESHQYRTIYASVEAYLKDFETAYNRVHEITGVKAEIFRFPGGSVNSYNGAVYQEIIAEMTRRGFSYYDWNVSSADATGNVTAAAIEKNCLSGVRAHKRSIVLMHDSTPKKTTVQALPAIVDTLLEEGYAFAPLSRDVLPVAFGYAN